MATKYIVLALNEKDGSWDELDTVEASSDSAAKKKALTDHRPGGATVVAVPARSWKPEDLKPKLSFV